MEFFNQRWHDYTGLSLQEALGWGWKVTIHPEDLEKLEDTWFKFVASGEPGAVEARIFDQAGLQVFGSLSEVRRGFLS